MELKGRVALVTGGATGIGLCYVKQLLANDVKHAVIADANLDSGKAAQKELDERYGRGRATVMRCDVTNADEFEGVFRQIKDTFGTLDIVINNAGILNDKLWELEIAVNVAALIRGTQLAFQLMSSGVIVNIASILGLQSLGGCPVYVGSKHAVVGFSRSFAARIEGSGVRVVTMCPGVTDTELISKAGQRVEAACSRRVVQELAELPEQRPEHVACEMMRLVAGGENGSVWVCEGGEPAYEVTIPDRRTMRK